MDMLLLQPMFPLLILVAVNGMLLRPADKLLASGVLGAGGAEMAAEDLSEDIDDGVSDLFGRGFPSEIPGAYLQAADVLAVENLLHRLLDGQRLLAHVEAIPQHHRRGEDLGRRVDHSFA